MQTYVVKDRNFTAQLVATFVPESVYMESMLIMAEMRMGSARMCRMTGEE